MMRGFHLKDTSHGLIVESHLSKRTLPKNRYPKPKARDYDSLNGDV